MKEGINTSEETSFERESHTAVEPAAELLPSTDFVKVEKNLASLGFFTPSSNRLRNAQEKSFTITTVADGQRLELKGTIIPSAKYGLPITADQDKWIALCKILTDIIRKDGVVTNPVSFTSAEILRLLHKHRHSGKNYREVEEWLDVLFSTTIFSEGVVYLAKEKRRVKDRFRVFDRAVSVGKELSDGKVADKNYVWFSEWQLQNINSNHLLPIDLEAYRELKNHIAKALVPLLQVWLYATRNDGVFEKRYNELCEFLNIRRYQYHSLIVQTLGPSLDELKRFGYLADWRVDKTSEGDSYKIVFYHGDKFHRDRRARLSRKQQSDGTLQHPPEDRTDVAPSSQEEHNRIASRQHPLRLDLASSPTQTFDPQLVGEFTRRGITEKKALELLTNLKVGQDVVAQMELGENIVQNARIPITNPAGFYIRLIESNTSVPESFETKAKRKAREENERKERERRTEEDARQRLEWEYDDYCSLETNQYIEANPVEFEAVKDARRAETHERHAAFPPDMIESIAQNEAKREIRKQLPHLTFEEFVNRKQQPPETPDFFLKPVAVLTDAPITTIAPQSEDVVMTDDAVVHPDPSETEPEAEMEPAMGPEPEPREDSVVGIDETSSAESAIQSAIPGTSAEPQPQPATPEAVIELGPAQVLPEPEGDTTTPEIV